MADLGFGFGGFASGLGNGYRLGQSIRNNNMTYQLNALKLRQQQAAFQRQQSLLQDSQSASDDTRKAIAGGDVNLKDAGTYWATKHAPQLALDYMQNGDFDSAQKLMAFAQNAQHQDIMNKQATLAGAIHWAKDSGNYSAVDKAMGNLYNSLPQQLTGGVQYQGSKVNDDGSINVTFADPKSGKQFQQNYRDLDTLQTSVEPYLNPQVYYSHLQNAGLIGALDSKGGQSAPAAATAPAAQGADLLSPQPTADASPNLGGTDAAATAKGAAAVDPGAVPGGAAPAGQTASAAPTGGDVTPDASPVAAEGAATPQAIVPQAPALPQIKQPIQAPQMSGAAPVVPAQMAPMPMPVQNVAALAGQTAPDQGATPAAPAAPNPVQVASAAVANPTAADASQSAPATLDQRFAALNAPQDAGAAAAQAAPPVPQPVPVDNGPVVAQPMPPVPAQQASLPAAPIGPDASQSVPDAQSQPNVTTLPVQTVDPAKAAAFAGPQAQPAQATPQQQGMFQAIPQGLRDYAKTLLMSNDPAQVKAGQTLVTSLMSEYGKPQTVTPGSTVFAFGKPVYTNEAGSLTDQAATLLAAQLRMGDDSAVGKMGRGAIGSLNQAKVINMMASQGATAPELMQAKQKFAAAQKAQKDFATGKQGDVVTSFNVAINHLDLLRNLAQAMGNGDIRTANSLWNSVRTEFGSDLPTNVDAAKHIVSAEIAKAVTGSGGALADREDLQKPIDTANSWQQISGVIDKTYLPLMAGQLEGKRRQYQFSTHQNDFDQMLSPRTQQYLQQHEAAQAQASFSPPSNWQYSPSRQMYRDPAGNLYDKSGQPVRAS